MFEGPFLLSSRAPRTGNLEKAGLRSPHRAPREGSWVEPVLPGMVVPGALWWPHVARCCFALDQGWGLSSPGEREA